MKQGVAVSISAGNSGPSSETITIPGCSQHGFTVGATDHNDEAIADFSSRGQTSDGRIKPDISAPGTNIMAPEANTNGYTAKSGTSMAAPYIAGTFALIKQENPDIGPEEKFEAVLETAIDLNEESYVQGEGRVNITAALEYALDYEDSEETEQTEQETGTVDEQPTENGDETQVEEDREAEQDQDSRDAPEEEQSGSSEVENNLQKTIWERVRQILQNFFS